MGHPGSKSSPPGKEKVQLETLKALAASKRLPIEFLTKTFGVVDMQGGGINLPYWDITGQEAGYTRERGSQGCVRKGSRFLNPPNTKLQPYAQWLIHKARKAGNRLTICEGESDTWVCWYCKIPALGCPGNSMYNSILAEHLETFTDLYVSEDREQGKSFVAGVANRLGILKFAGTARVLRWPAEYKDLGEVFAADPNSFLDRYREAVERSEIVYEPNPSSKGGANSKPAPRLLLRNADSYRMRPVDWLVPDFIPMGLTIIAGDGGFGKSSLTVHLAAAIGQGGRCFGLDYPAPAPGRTLLIGCEDSPEATVLPRLAAADAVMARVSLVGDVQIDGTDSMPLMLSPSHIETLENAIRDLGDVLLVVIDPVSAFVPEQLDDHKDAHTRRMLRPLADMAERLNIAVVLIKHLSKSETGNGANLVAGSRAYVNAARAALLVGADPDHDDEDDRRVLVFTKKNLTRCAKGIAFRAAALTEYEQDLVLNLPQAEGLSDKQQQALRDQLFRLEWLGDTDATDKDLARARRGNEQATGNREDRVKGCLTWLRGHLASGAQSAEDILAAARKATFSKNIVYDAKKLDLNVKCSNKGNFGGKWHWWYE